MGNAASGRNLDITELARLTVPLNISQGGHGSTDASQGLKNLIKGANGVPFDDGTYAGTLKQGTLTAARTWTLPDATGTIALTSGDDSLNGAGRVLQVKTAQLLTYASTGDIIPLDDTIPQKSEGGDLLDMNFTPRSATSKLIITVEANLIHLVTSAAAIFSVFVGSADDAAGASLLAAEQRSNLTCVIDSPGTDEVAIQLRGGPVTTGTLFINGNSASELLGGVSALTLRVTEVAA